MLVVNRKLRALLAAAGIAVIGCGQPIRLVQRRPAQIRLPDDVRRLAVGHVQPGSKELAQWAQAAEKSLRRRLASYADRCGRFEVVSTSERPDAICHGVVERVRQLRRTLPGKGRWRSQPRHRLRCAVTICFTLVRPDGTALASQRVTRSYDSLDPAAGPAEPRRILRRLVEDCVATFVSGLFDVETVLTARLQPGSSEDVRAGNEHALAGRYAEALACYQRALLSAPEDPSALLNAALMAELLGRGEQAEQYYRRALQTTGRRPALEGLRRVRRNAQERAEQP